MTPANLANDYIERLRNPAKRDYAERYWQWLQRNPLHDPLAEPPQAEQLSAMAAQAVRMSLRQFQ